MSVVDARGRVVIPFALREALGLEPGTMVIVTREGDRLVVSRVPDVRTLLQNALRKAKGRQP